MTPCTACDGLGYIRQDKKATEEDANAIRQGVPIEWGIKWICEQCGGDGKVQEP